MAVTTEHYYTGNASTTSFAYTFPYYKTSDIKVTWDGVLKTEGTHYDVTGTNIVFKTSPTDYTPANNVVIRIYRDTDVDTSKATFAAGNAIRATDLNNNQLQILYSLQERQSSGKVNTNISPKAEIDVSKLKDGTARQVIQTAANGNDVEWTSNIDVPGTLDVTGATTLDGGLAVTGNITVSGNVDGRNISTDGTKLDGIEANATADQTGTQIKTAYENESNTNAYTDAEKTKLAGIATGANVTDANTVNSAGAVMNTDLDGKGELLVGDGNGDPSALAVGSNNFVLTADSNETTGVKWAAAPGADGEANQNAFSNIAVSGQTTVAADTTTDTLTLVGGSNITLTTDASGDSVTIAASSAGEANQNAFSNIAVSGQTTVAADSATDTFTIVGGSNVTVTTDASTDSVTIAASGGEITVQDEGNSLSTAATTLNFVGSGVTATGSGATKTITISGGGGGSVTTDFQYLELKAHNNTSGAFSAGSADYELVTKGTTTAVSPTQAAALLISIGGVIQEPNTGTSIGSNDGFCIDGSSIHFGANLTAHPEYILYLKGSGEVTALANNTVTTSKIVDTNVTLAKLEHGTSSTDGKFLRSNNGADPTWETVNTTIADDSIVEAKLDIHADPSGTNKFLGYTSNGMEWAVPPDTNTQVGGATGVDFNDDVKARFGTGNDLEIYHSGSTSFIKDVGTGNLEIWGDGNVKIKSGDGTETKATFDTNGSVDLYYDNSKKFETTADGIHLHGEDGTGSILEGDLRCKQVDSGTTRVHWDASAKEFQFKDEVKAVFGDSDDLEIYHDGTDSFINNDTGILNVTNNDFRLKTSGSETMLRAQANSTVELMYDNSVKFATSNTGVTVTGTVAATSYTGDGSALTGVGGASADGCIYENDQTISNNYTIAAGKGAHSVGPITVNATVTVNGNWVVS